MDIFTFPDGTQDFTYAYFVMIGLFFFAWLTIFLLKRSNRKAVRKNDEHPVYEMGETTDGSGSRDKERAD
ncbi:hypothetical protein [Alteribacter natronophilus]|uniref:hypothetical protein n=1 Tax=Alteribacter natronophilus TaxID=2583810 RepID=UPI00110DF87B|nr:hypothetical protein [Alteribacter natronophilus]TMW73443.1 hypothetical protein FGB90_03845 [Alteribacter natronophilus]